MSEAVQVTTQTEQKSDESTANVFFDKSPGMVEDVVKTEEKTVEETPKTEETPKEDETKTEDDKKTDDLDLKIPEGSLLEQAEIDEVKALAKESNLSVEQAQKILDARSASVSNYLKKAQEKHVEQTKQWSESIKSDRELGGEKYTESISLARKAVEKFASPELKKVLDDTGYGNHPELVRVFSRVGKMLSDAKLVQAPKSPAAPRSFEDVFYSKKD